MTAAEDFVVPSEDDVFDYIDNIPARYRRCAAAQHNWQPHDWTGYRGGKALKAGADPRKAQTFEVTEACAGVNGCGLKRHYTFKVAGTRVYDRSTYTYSDRNETITSPYGISTTGISVRREVANANILRRIFQNPVQLEPAGETAKALSHRKRKVA
ncbi:hypothetical protein [Streptomyces sp. NPDC017260]|uniref:hypothetical protein n=1 Tax=unclassified Streptomyces TaxID=2593676 RepID=UPI003787ECC4